MAHWRKKDRREAAAASASRRIAAIDIARGAALLAMAAYHFSWDLASVRLVDWPVASAAPWRAFAMAIAASFLFIAGVSLHLAHRDAVNIPAFLARLVRLALAAAAVSVATYAVFPQSGVFFGILHMMAVGSLIALPLRRLPAAALVLLAAGAVALPALWTTPLFDGTPLVITGLSATVPASNDFVPIFPWIAPMLLGLAAGRPIAARAAGGTAPKRAAPRLIALLGRWSLAFYLIHQLALYGLAAGLAQVLPVDPARERASFLADCVGGCTDNGGERAYCRRFCGCVAATLDDTSIWLSRAPDASLQPVIASAAASCELPPGFDLSTPEDGKKAGQ